MAVPFFEWIDEGKVQIYDSLFNLKDQEYEALESMRVWDTVQVFIDGSHPEVEGDLVIRRQDIEPWKFHLRNAVLWEKFDPWFYWDVDGVCDECVVTKIWDDYFEYLNDHNRARAYIVEITLLEIQ